MIPTSKNEVDVYLNASNANPDEVSAFAAVNFLTSSTSGSSIQDPSVTALIDNPIFTMSPGQQKTLHLNIQTSNSPMGIYTIRVTLLAGDSHGCSLQVNPIDLSLYVKPSPDFTLLVDNSPLKVLRGAPPTKAIVEITAVDGTAAPLRFSYTSQWDTANESTPSNVTSALMAPATVLEPGQSQNATLELAAPIIDDPNLAGSHYTGTFTYTIIATGTWNETATLQGTIVKRLDIPVSITEQPFDFKITSDKQTAYLNPKESTSIGINVEYLSGRHFPVSLHIEGFTLGMTIHLDKMEGVGNYNSTMIIDPVNLNFGHRDIQIRAEGGGVTRLLPITLSQAPFKIVIDPDTTSILSPGQSSTLTVSVTPNLQDYKSKVTLSIESSLKNSPFILKLENAEGAPPFSTQLYVSSNAEATISNSTELIINATDGQFTESIRHLFLIRQQIQVDLEPRLDSLSLDDAALSKNQLPLIISTTDMGGAHRIIAQPEIILGSGTKYVFTGWNDGVKSNERVLSSTQISALTIVGIYQPQYYLNITSAFGDVKGAGWYDNATMAKIELQREVSTNSGVNQQFIDWTGPSSSFLGKSCDGQTIDQGIINAQEALGNYSICMNRPQTLVAAWKTAEVQVQGNNNTLIGIAGGGAIAAVAGTFAYLKFLRPTIQKIPGTEQLLEQQSVNSNQSSNNNQQKPQQRNFPVLQWHVRASRVIRSHGRTFVDVLVENVGQTDVKKVKIDVTCPPGLQYDGGTMMIDLMLANESRKVSFSLRHMGEEQGPFEVTLALGYEFMTKFVRRNDDKKITLNVRQLRLALVRPDVAFESEVRAFNAIKAWIEEKGIAINEVDMPSLRSRSMQSSLEADSLIVSVEAFSRSKELADFLNERAKSGISVFVYSTGDDQSYNNEGYRRIANMIGFSPSDIHQIKVKHGFGLRVLNAEHPITRNYYGSDIFRIADQAGALDAGSVAENAIVLVEQGVIAEGGGENELRNIPAILVSTESGRSVIYFNIPIAANIVVISNLLDRALLFASRMLE